MNKNQKQDVIGWQCSKCGWATRELSEIRETIRADSVMICADYQPKRKISEHGVAKAAYEAAWKTRGEVGERPVSDEEIEQSQAAYRSVERLWWALDHFYRGCPSHDTHEEMLEEYRRLIRYMNGCARAALKRRGGKGEG